MRKVNSVALKVLGAQVSVQSLDRAASERKKKIELSCSFHRLQPFSAV